MALWFTLRHAGPRAEARGGTLKRALLLALTAGAAAGQVSLDGRLDEPAWQAAQVMKLTQQSPRPGEPTPYTTEARVILTRDRLYIGFLCRDPLPRAVAIHTMQRDSEMEGDDTVAVALDTYGDRKTGYWFRINAAGARADGLIADPEHPSFDWDGIWDARTARTSEGWSAEIEIPSRTLSFTPGLEEWGLNLERFVARDRITLRWASPTLDAFFYDLSRAGRLAGAGEVEQGLGIELSPYAIGRSKEFFARSPRAWQGAAGADFTWKITPQLVTVFTANTDFAETEVDTRQINLTRFPLFFPEKRSFFLEGANQYEFGLGLGSQFIPFFTRRIGLLHGEQIPIQGGVKLNGRVGRWNLAFLDVQTRDTVTGDGPVRGTNLMAGRVSYDVTDQLRLGSLVTNGNPEGTGGNSLFGFDAVWRTSKFRGNKNLLAGAWAARTRGEAGPGSRTGWGYKIDYPNDLVDCAHHVNHYGEALDPALGFLPRPGARYLRVGCHVSPRPSKQGPFGWIRQASFESEYERWTNSRGFTESWQYVLAPVNLHLESGDRLESAWASQFEYLTEPFEIVDGVFIPPGPYRFSGWVVEAETSEHRPLQAGIGVAFGTFYNGRLTQWENFVRWTSPGGRVQLGLEAENNFGRLPGASFVQRLWQTQWTFAWNPNLVFSSFLQYDTESQNLGANTRLRWTLKPGNDLFVVWNRGWQRLILNPHERSIIPENELLAVKLRWTFRP